MNNTIPRLQYEISVHKKRNVRLPKEIKEKAVSMLDQNISLRRLAKSLNLSPSTLFKWKEKYNFLPLTKKNEKGLTFKQVLVFTLLFIFFLLCEYYLLYQSYLFHYFTMGDEQFALIKSVITEIMPIILTLIITIFDLNFFKKNIIVLCLLCSFLLSVFIASGFSIDELNKDVSMNISLKSKRKSLTKNLQLKSELINFYKDRSNSNGSTGWPLTVLKLQKERDQINKELIELEDQVLGNGIHEVKMANNIFNIILKILIQLTSYLIISVLVQFFFNSKIEKLSGD